MAARHFRIQEQNEEPEQTTDFDDLTSPVERWKIRRKPRKFPEDLLPDMPEFPGGSFI